MLRVDSKSRGRGKFFGAEYVLRRHLHGMQRSRASGEHGGGAPIPPLLGHGNGKVRVEGACGRQRMREHVLSGKMVAGAMCENDRFHRSSNRGLLSAGVSMRSLAGRLPVPRAEIASCTVPTFGCGFSILSFGCGGVSKIAQFHRSVRQVWCVPELTDSAFPSFRCDVSRETKKSTG